MAGLVDYPERLMTWTGCLSLEWCSWGGLCRHLLETLVGCTVEGSLCCREGLAGASLSWLTRIAHDCSRNFSLGKSVLPGLFDLLVPGIRWNQHMPQACFLSQESLTTTAPSPVLMSPTAWQAHGSCHAGDFQTLPGCVGCRHRCPHE